MSERADNTANVPGPEGLRPRTLVELLRLRAERQPRVISHTFLADGERQEVELTYGELDASARAVAARLLEFMKPGARALLLYPPGPDYLAAFYGCLYAGVIAVPAYPPRLNRSLLRLHAVTADSGAAAALTTRAVLDRVTPALSQDPLLNSLRWLATDAGGDEAPAGGDRVAPEPGEQSLAFLQYTSGSTGTPKGVMLTHANLLHNARLVYAACGHRPGERYMSWLPVFHDMGFMAGILQPLYGGFHATLMSPAAFLQSPVRWLQAVTRARATTSGGPDFAYELCVRKVTPEQRAELDLGSWAVAFNGAEPVRSGTLERFGAAFAECGFRRESFYPCYGLAEATLMVSGGNKSEPYVTRIFDADALRAGRAVTAGEEGGRGRVLVGCGRTMRGQRIAIVNPLTMLECGPGDVGEVWVSGPSVARGYWGRPAETEQTFGARLAGTGEGPFLRTGDSGTLLEGELFMTGRLKDLIIIRGLNHYPQDIEATVERSHPELRPGCGAAFSVEAEGAERLVIVQEVGRHCRDLEGALEKIARTVGDEHELQPYAVLLVGPGAVPKTSSGKIQRHACREGFLAGTFDVLAQWRPAGVSAEVSAPPAAKTVDLEGVRSWLLSLLAARLKVGDGLLRPEDPPSRYGLDSLTAVEIKHEIESSLGVELSATGLLEADSISGLAEEIHARLSERRTREEARASGAGETQYPLSRGQQALWYLYRLAQESAAYNVSFAARVQAAVDVWALRDSFQSLVDRHAALRTTFDSVGGQPFQRVRGQAEVCFTHVEAGGWSDARVEEALADEAYRPLNLEEGPVLRVHLFTRSSEEHFLLLTAHHIVADFWSLAVLVRELGALYEAKREGRDAELPPLRFGYGDHVRRQEEAVAGPDSERLRAYWHARLGGGLPPLELPTDRPRPPEQTYRGAAHTFRIGPDATRRLEALCREHRATLYMGLLAVFQFLLHRYTGQTDVTLGSPTAGRERQETAGAVGYFVNPVVLRADLSGDPTFASYLERVRRDTLDDFKHQEYPFPTLVEELQPKRDPSRPPLFNVMFVYQKTRLPGATDAAVFAVGGGGARIEVGGLPLESVELKRRTAQLDLTLTMAEAGSGLVAAVEYNTDLFEAETIDRFCAHLCNLLEAAAAEPDARLSELPLMGDEEQRRLLFDLNATARDYPKGDTIHRLFERQAALTPGRVALIQGHEQVTYAELNVRANRLARHLRGMGVGLESKVGVLTGRSAGMVVSLLGVLKAGGAYVPLDANYPAERLAFMLEDTAAGVVLTEGRLRQSLPPRPARVVCVDGELDALSSLSGRDLEDVGPTPGNLAYVIYTSGSTGRPKGVAITHAGAAAFVQWAADTYTREELSGVLASTSICFDLSVFELFATLAVGGTVVLAESALELSALPAAGRVTLVNTVPSAMAELVRLGGLPAGVRVVNLAGEALKRGLVERVYAAGAVERVYNLYGPSEDTTYSTFALIERGAGAPVTIGRPIANTRAYVLDRWMRPVPEGVTGELYLGGEGLARGYLNRPALTAERFAPDPFSTEAGARLYRTGDLVRYLPDGRIDYLGRADQQVKVRGYRIELGEIEAALSSHASVGECVVAAREEVSGDKRLVAYFVADGAEDPSAAELRRHLRERLPDYMVPAAFVTLDALPLTANGKVDRRRLPAAGVSDAPAEYVEPRGETERVVAQVWAEVLGVGRVGVRDNFFELGGHSLLATQIVSRIGKEYGLALSLQSVFKAQTVEELAQVIEGARRAGGKRKLPAIKPRARGDYRVKQVPQVVLHEGGQE